MDSRLNGGMILLLGSCLLMLLLVSPISRTFPLRTRRKGRNRSISGKTMRCLGGLAGSAHECIGVGRRVSMDSGRKS